MYRWPHTHQQVYHNVLYYPGPVLSVSRPLVPVELLPLSSRPSYFNYDARLLLHANVYNWYCGHTVLTTMSQISTNSQIPTQICAVSTTNDLNKQTNKSTSPGHKSSARSSHTNPFLCLTLSRAPCVDRSLGETYHPVPGILPHWYPGYPGSWILGILAPILPHWYPEYPGSWTLGILVSWCPGILDPILHPPPFLFTPGLPGETCHPGPSLSSITRTKITN